MGDLEAHLVGLALSRFDAAGFLDATLRAFERAQGALEADATKYLRDRAAEAKKHAARSAKELSEFAMEAAQAQGAIAADDELRAVAADRRARELFGRAPVALNRVLSDSAMAMLFEAGVRIEELRRITVRAPSGDPWSRAGRAISRAGIAAARMADELRAWEPLPRG